MKSSSSRPTGLSANAVTTAVFSPKQRFNPRATLYSPPPSHTSNFLVVVTRRSPGSSRSITSPRETSSHWHFPRGLIAILMIQVPNALSLVLVLGYEQLQARTDKPCPPL